jgi:uncharacterized membrane protein
MPFRHPQTLPDEVWFGFAFGTPEQRPGGLVKGLFPKVSLWKPARLLHRLKIRGRRRVMEARAKLFGHPIHQMLIVFPLGVLGMSLFFDLVAISTHRPALQQASYYMIAAGIAAGLLAAVFGLIDFLGIPGGTRAKRVGLLHGAGNVVVVVLFAASWWLRRPSPSAPGTTPLVLSAIAVAIALVTGWLGGELVDRLAIGVDDGAHPNAPSSLSGPVR